MVPQTKKQNKRFQTFILNKRNGQEPMVTGNKLDNFIWQVKITKKQLTLTQKKIILKDWLRFAESYKETVMNKL